MKETTFIAIEPPGNIVKPYYALQDVLFRSSGLTTARLFPPIIPVAFLFRQDKQDSSRAPADRAAFPSGKEIFDRIRSRVESAAKMHSAGELRIGEKTVYVPIEAIPETSLEEYVPGNLFFPPQPGILLCLLENSAILEAQLSSLGSVPAQSWYVNYIAEIKVRYSCSRRSFETARWEYKRYEKIVCGRSA